MVFDPLAVRVGGTVIVTALLGHKVRELLVDASVGETWDARQDGTLKYSIRREYADDEFTDAGQQIGVLLPFSDGEYYSEYLLNVTTFSREFRARGFETASVTSFASRFAEFETRNPSAFKALSPIDFEYLGLHGEIVFKRTHAE